MKPKVLSLKIIKKWPFYVLLILGFGYLLKVGPEFQPDSMGYLTLSSIRSMGYPLLLKGFQAIFGQHFQVLIFLQLILGFGASYWLSKELKHHFRLKTPWISEILMFVLLVPYLGHSKIGNTVLTEPICYPFFLFWVGYFGRWILHGDYKSFLKVLIWTALLIVMRRQFLFLYPVLALALLYQGIRHKKMIWRFLLGFLISIVVVNIVERTYQYGIDGHFSTVPFTGVQLINAPLFVSKPDSWHVLKDPIQRDLFKSVYEKMQHRGYTYDAVPKDNEIYTTPLERFTGVYNLICWKWIIPEMAQLGISDPYVMDHILSQMSVILIQHHLPAYLNLYLKNVIINLGGYYYSLFLGIVVLILGWLLWSTLDEKAKRLPSESACLFLFFMTIANFVNFALTGLVEPVLQRYTIYTESLQAIALLMFIVVALESFAIKQSKT